jgi:hypothetical protein
LLPKFQVFEHGEHKEQPALIMQGCLKELNILSTMKLKTEEDGVSFWSRLETVLFL